MQDIRPAVRLMKSDHMETEMKKSWRVLVGRLSNVAARGNNLANDVCLRLHFGIRDFIVREEAQDLVEYALIVALIALACTAGMNKLASGLKGAFSSIATTLSSDT